jgi:hypothetical protein
MIDGTSRKKCMFLSQRLECLVGGFGNLECFDPAVHNRCEHKKRSFIKDN